MKTLIHRHNSKVINKNCADNQKNTRACNCRKKEDCPLSGKCLATSLVYAADVTTDNGSMTYIGMTGGEFKTRYSNHKKSFSNPRYEKESELSKYLWALKRGNKNFEIKWRIIKHAPVATSSNQQCRLCMEEKLTILNADKSCLLNKRSELIIKCRHNAKQRKKAPGLSICLLL